MTAPAANSYILTVRYRVVFNFAKCNIRSMSYRELTVCSRSRLKRYSHGKRFILALELLDLRENDSVLDYGAGDGYLVRSIRGTGIPLTVTGYEPDTRIFREMQEGLNSLDKIYLVNDLQALGQAGFDKIACLEVLEHLDRPQQQAALHNMAAMLKKDGSLVVSVPIEIGPGALFKNIARLVIGQAHSGTTAANVLKSLLGLRISRKQGGAYINSHIGFDHRELEKVFRQAGLEIIKKTFSPWPLLGGFINSQILYRLTVPSQTDQPGTEEPGGSQET